MKVPGLPENFTEHGRSIDTLFGWMFWTTSLITVGVIGVMILFLLRYRSTSKAGTSGESESPRGSWLLETIWTIVPLLILTAFALASTRIWDRYRSPSDSNDQRPLDPVRVMVIGQQFKWNVIYAGRDNRIGRYLIYPKPTDLTWPAYPDLINPKKLTTTFKNLPGPAALPQRESLRAIADYIEQANPLGKDFSDFDGIDDDWSRTPGRPMFLPARRAVEILVTSKDVIHDFFVPNFRIKLDAVPGRLGRIALTLTDSSTRRVSIDDMPASTPIWLGAESPITHPTEIVTVRNRSAPLVLIRNLQSMNEAAAVIIQRRTGRPRDQINEQEISETIDWLRRTLKDMNKSEVTGIVRPFEVVCEELCGPEHYTMRNELHVLSAEEFDAFLSGIAEK